MRQIIDIIESVSNGVRIVSGIFALVVMGTVLVTVFGVTRVASSATDEFAVKAELLGEKAIEARLEAERDRALAKDGWGYSGDGLGAEDFPADNRRRVKKSGSENAGGWGNRS